STMPPPAGANGWVVEGTSSSGALLRRITTSASAPRPAATSTPPRRKNGDELLPSSLTALRVGGAASGVPSPAAARGLSSTVGDADVLVGAATAERVSRTVAASP